MKKDRIPLNLSRVADLLEFDANASFIKDWLEAAIRTMNPDTEKSGIVAERMRSAMQSCVQLQDRLAFTIRGLLQLASEEYEPFRSSL